MDDDWDLQAVVRGCCRSSAAISSSQTLPAAADPLAFFSASLLEEDDNNLLCFPDDLVAQTGMQELEELCKPFYLKTPQPFSQPPHSLPSISPISALNGQQQQQSQLSQRPSTPPPQISRSKRRKNQQKRVVCEVPAEGLSSDMWAWRKYGQKPIKGSPYPRGYYRCSSSKGCLARKQVERSRSDPTMFIITYTAEHNHPLPTHRNSLAGSTRNKASSTSGLSPTTPLTATMEDDQLFLQQLKKKADEEEEEGEEEVEEEEEEVEEVMTQMADDMFLDLKEAGSENHFSDPFSSSWFSGYSATTASDFL